MPLETKLLYEFGRFRLDPGQRLLLCEGKPVSLSPKAFELLLVLIKSGGCLLTKDDLMRQLWPNSFVEEANLTVNISALRKALGDTLDGQELIATVPKHGYRFLAPVTVVQEEDQPSKRAAARGVVQPISDGPDFHAGAIPADRLATNCRLVPAPGWWESLYSFLESHSLVSFTRSIGSGLPESRHRMHPAAWPSFPSRISARIPTAIFWATPSPTQ